MALSMYQEPEAMKSRDDPSLRLPLSLPLPLPLALKTSPPPSPEPSTSTSPSPTPGGTATAAAAAAAAAASLLPPGLHPALLSAHSSFLGQMRQAAFLGGLSPALLDYWTSLSGPTPQPQKRPINNNNNSSVNNYNTVSRTHVQQQPSSPSSGSSPQSMGSDGCGTAVQLPTLSAPASSPAPSATPDAARDKQFTCLVCQRSFGYKHVLQNHERTHTGEKPFECVECHKRFTRDHHLKTHMRLHTGEKPYHCEHCDRQFVQVANLRRHLRVHTGEKPYGCELCDARFSDSNQLKAHVLIHKGEKPFGCDGCKGRFRRRHHLENHKCPARTSASTAPPVTAAAPAPFSPGVSVSITPLRASAATFKHRLLDWDGSTLMPPVQTEPEDLSVRRLPGASPPHSGADSSRSRSRSPSPGSAASPTPTPPASDWSDDAEPSYLDSIRHPKFRHVSHGPAS